MIGDDETRTILTYYAYRATSNPGFFYPIYTLFLLANDLTYTQIGTIATIQAVLVVAGEVPTGYLGDRIGRRNSLVIGSVLFSLSTASFLVATDFPGFIVTFCLLSLGHTFVSGSGDAWLYDTLADQVDEDRFTYVRGRGAAIGQWVGAAGMVVGGALYVVDVTYPFLAGLGMGVVNLAILLQMPKNRQFTDEGEDGRLGILEALPVVRGQLWQPQLRVFVLYMALFTGALLTADMFIQPVAVDVMESNLAAMVGQLPEGATLGVLYASFTVVSAIASDRADDVKQWLGIRRAMLLVPVAVGVVYVLPAVVPLLVFPMFFVMKGSGSLVRPIAGQYLNDRVESVGRATVLSVVSMVYAVARTPFAIGSGAVADMTSPRMAVAVLGVIFLVGTALIYLSTNPIRTEDAAVDAAAD
jgi:MFS family permease